MTHPESPISRRDALRILGAVGAALAGPGLAAPRPDEFVRRPIPKSGELLPAVGLGTWKAFDVPPGSADAAALREVLRRFAEGGGRVVDSSPMYGDAEATVGELAAGLGILPKLFVATKVWTSGRDAGIRQMETSMRRLRVEKLDLMQVHNLVDVGVHLQTLRRWKEAGKIRYLGVTHYRADAYPELERLMKSEPLDFVQFNYNIAVRDAEQRLLPACADTRTAVIVNRPFEDTTLFRQVKGKALPPWAAEFDCASWAQFFLKYILSHPAVTCVIPATSKPEHLADNLGAMAGRLPDAAMRRKMAEYWQSV